MTDRVVPVHPDPDPSVCAPYPATRGGAGPAGVPAAAPGARPEDRTAE